MTKLRAAALLAGMLTTSLCPAPSSALTMDNWAPPQWLTDVSALDGWSKSGPSIDVDDNGVANAIWVTPGGVNLSRSTDGGETWYQVYVPESHLDAGVRNAMIAHSGGNNWIAMWTIQNFELDRIEAHFSRSSDGGQTWTPPEGLPFSAFRNTQFPMDLSANKNNTIVGILETETPPRQIGDFYGTTYWYILSPDGGQTWISNTVVGVYANNHGHCRVSNHDNKFVIATTTHGNCIFLQYSTDRLADLSTSTTKNDRWRARVTIITPSVYLEDVLQNADSTLVVTRNTRDAEASSTLTMHHITDEGQTRSITHSFAVENLVPESTRLEHNTSGEILMTYATSDVPGKVYVTASSDDGLTWTSPTAVLDSLGRSAPAIADRADGKFLLATSTSVPAPQLVGTVSQINASTLSNATSSLTVADHGYISELANEEPYNYNKDLAMTFGNDHTVIAAWNAGH